MAENDVNMQQQLFLEIGFLKDKEEERRLKYLQFVQVAAVHAVLTFTNLYIYAKDKAGPLKPGVETVEGTVKSVVGPVYDKFREVPIEVLKFVDRKIAQLRGDVRGLVFFFLYGMLLFLKFSFAMLIAYDSDESGMVDESVTNMDNHVPPLVKQVSSRALLAAQNAPVAARAVASEVQRAGVKETASELAKSVYSKYEPTAKELYSKYEPKAEQAAVSAWRKLNQLPLFPQVAQVVVPTAAFCSEKYNQTILSTAEKGYKVSLYLPLVPTEKIAKVFSDEVPESAPLVSS
ncbi:hypothetical protein POTOM_020442 [Populus tomentosa]|uniref:Rubber elongation factor family protein n=1 Tax=Populus tomentosa TaxID=118781 RepID=A0A8X8CRL9_POPTO|nr:hypothetical protein POTOM_020442 [Populus tomentosa]